MPRNWNGQENKQISGKDKITSSEEESSLHDGWQESSFLPNTWKVPQKQHISGENEKTLPVEISIPRDGWQQSSFLVSGMKSQEMLEDKVTSPGHKLQSAEGWKEDNFLPIDWKRIEETNFVALKCLRMMMMSQKWTQMRLMKLGRLCSV